MSVLIKQNHNLVKNITFILQRHYSNEITKSHYDVIIAGGGMVGTTLASILGNNKKFSNKRILLLESSSKFKWEPKEEYSKRVSALSPGTVKLMESIGAWKIMTDIRVGPVKNMQVWDGLSDAMITFDKDNLTDTIAYIVENNLIIHAVTEVLRDKENITILHETKIKDYKLPNLHENDAEIFLENGEKYSCNLLVSDFLTYLYQ